MSMSGRVHLVPPLSLTPRKHDVSLPPTGRELQVDGKGLAGMVPGHPLGWVVEHGGSSRRGRDGPEEICFMVRDSQSNDNPKWCFAWYAARSETACAERAAPMKNAQWTPGDAITVSFLDGDPIVQRQVRDIVR